MNIDDPLRIRLHKRRRQQPHITRKTNKLDAPFT
jgi:hypothetical protein